MCVSGSGSAGSFCSYVTWNIFLSVFYLHTQSEKLTKREVEAKFCNLSLSNNSVSDFFRGRARWSSAAGNLSLLMSYNARATHSFLTSEMGCFLCFNALYFLKV